MRQYIKQYDCSHCGARDIEPTRDATVQWNRDTQEWEHNATQDAMYCEKCGAEYKSGITPRDVLNPQYAEHQQLTKIRAAVLDRCKKSDVPYHAQKVCLAVIDELLQQMEGVDAQSDED